MFMKKANPFVRVLSATWVVYALISMAVSTPIIAAILADGNDLLGLPGWSWVFALSAWIVALVLHVRLRSSDTWRTNTTAATLIFLVSSASIIPVLYIFGFLGHETMPALQQHGVTAGNSLALDFELAFRGLAKLVAWISLTFIPCVAILINISGIRAFKNKEKHRLIVADSDRQPGHVIIFGSTRAVFSDPIYDYQKSKDES